MNREILEGRMQPLPSAEKTSVTRQAFLFVMAMSMLAVAGHLAFLVGAALAPVLLP